VHAIWISILIPLMFLPVWLWPRLRLTRIWLGLSLFSLIALILWLVLDLRSFTASQGSLENLPARSLYLLLSGTGVPALQWICGCLVNLLFSMRFPSPGKTASPSEGNS